MKKYLVTGGTGFLGSALVHRLVREGNGVKVLDSNIRGEQSRLNDIFDRIEFIQADIRDNRAVEAACEGVDSLCHLAFLNGTEFFYRQPDLVLDIAVKGISNVIDSCMKKGVKELILASSSEVYQTPKKLPTDEKVALSIPDPLNPRYSYAAGKIINELMAINFGRKYFQRVVIFRPHNVYGPDMGWEHVIPQFCVRMKEIAGKNQDKKIDFSIQGNGKQTRSFVFIDDFINGLMMLIDRGEHLQIYNIGTSEELTIEQVAIEVGKFYAKEVRVVPGPSAEGGTLRRCPDITKLKKLGYSPIIPFNKGLKITATWYDKNAALKLKRSKIS